MEELENIFVEIVYGYVDDHACSLSFSLIQ